MKTFSLLAAAVACLAVLSLPTHAQENVLTAAADGSSAGEPMFLPGVATPSGLDSADGSAATEDAESPASTVKAADMGSMDGSDAMTETKPAPTGKSTSVPTPAPTTSAAPSALLGASVVAAAAATAFTVALL